MAPNRIPPPSTSDKHPPFTAYGKIAKITVGQGSAQKTFQIHNGLLCFYSGYFRTAFNGRWVESEHGAVELLTEDPITFVYFMHWLYTRKFIGNTQKQTPPDFESLFKLCIFADAFDAPLLYNEAVGAIHQCVLSTWAFPTSLVQAVYGQTTESSPLRRLVIEMIGRTRSNAVADFAPELQKYWCREAVIDMVQFTWGKTYKVNKEEFAKLDLCRFHQHEEGVTCKK